MESGEPGELLGLPISACGDRAGSGDDCSGEDPEGESDSSEFSPEEWARAQAKLVEAERRTGLTFLQRAKLRRQLLAGGVVDVPIFQQRYGPLPSWMTRGNEASSSSDPVMDSGAAGLASVFTVCGGVILALIGWSRVRVSCGRLHRNAAITLVSRVRDTGAMRGMPQDPGFQAQFRAVPDGEGIRWVPVAIQDAEEGLCASDGRSDPTGLLDEGALPRHGLEGQASDGVLNAAQLGTNGGVDNVDMSQQSHGSSDEQLDSSQQSHQSSDEQLDSSQQSCQSSDEQLEGCPQCPVGRQLTSAELVGGDQAQVGGSSEVPVLSEVAPGGRFAKAASSGVSASTVQVGGSSSSHGMAALPWPEPCYEDYYGDAMVVCFPYVGSWRSVNLLLALFSQVGEGVLRALGESVFTWRALRVVSLGLRDGVASALVEVLRRSCWATYFEGPQWQLAVDRYMVTGRIVEGPLELNASLGGQGGVSSEGPVFPYVEGPPGYAFHYLWRVFTPTGWLVLDFLGDRVSSWVILGLLRMVLEVVPLWQSRCD